MLNGRQKILGPNDKRCQSSSTDPSFGWTIRQVASETLFYAESAPLRSRFSDVDRYYCALLMTPVDQVQVHKLIDRGGVYMWYCREIFHNIATHSYAIRVIPIRCS